MAKFKTKYSLLHLCGYRLAIQGFFISTIAESLYKYLVNENITSVHVYLQVSARAEGGKGQPDFEA